MQPTTDPAETTWDTHYLGRFNHNLHSYLSTRYHRLDVTAGIIAALASSGVLCSLLAESEAHWLWIALGTLAAIAAACKPIFHWAENMALHTSLAQAYLSLEYQSEIQGADPVLLKTELRRLEMMEPVAKPLFFERLRERARIATDRQLIGQA